MFQKLSPPLVLVDGAILPPAGATLRRLFQYLRPYYFRMLATVSVYVVCVIIANFYPFIDRMLIDEHIAIRNPDGFLPLLAFAALFHGLNYFGVLIRSMLIARISCQHAEVIWAKVLKEAAERGTSWRKNCAVDEHKWRRKLLEHGVSRRVFRLIGARCSPS